MDADRIQAEIYVERLQQAVRVMAGLSETDRAHFDVDIWATVRDGNFVACVAGHCGQDPWFQAQGLFTYVGAPDSREIGSIYPHPIEFFGTDTAFYRHTYEPALGGRAVTVDDAIAALKQAIREFGGDESSDMTAAS